MTKKKVYMNPEVKAKWVDALRSGKYEQSSGQLRSEDGFCCLGVLCDIYGKEKKKKSFDEYGCFLLGGAEHLAVGINQFLPAKVSKWAGIDKSRLHYHDKLEHQVVTSKSEALDDLNDTRKYTFEQIADVIEKDF